MTKSLDESLSFFKDKISDCIKSRKSIFVTTHIDCDGLTSGSIITKALIRAGAKCPVIDDSMFRKVAMIGVIVHFGSICAIYTFLL